VAGFNDSALNDAVNGIAAAATYISAHTADPGTGGTSEVAGGSYGRVQTTWGAASSGDRTGSQVAINIPAGTTVTHWGLWTTASGGTFKGGFALAGGSEAFTNAGTLDHTPTLDVDQG
jgi:hypothetical protein